MFKILMKYPDGSTEELEETFDLESEANEYGLYMVGCYAEGGEALHMSNPGDHPLQDSEADFDVSEVPE